MEFLRRLAAEPDLAGVKADVAFMAPAVDLESFSGALQSGHTALGRMRIFPMRDASEAKDALLGPLYPRSLLYMISGMLEIDEPDDLLLGLERSLDATDREWRGKETEWRKAGQDWLAADPGRIVYGPTDETAGVGYRTRATSHGAFDQDDQTLESLAHFLKSAP